MKTSYSIILMVLISVSLYQAFQVKAFSFKRKTYDVYVFNSINDPKPIQTHCVSEEEDYGFATFGFRNHSHYHFREPVIGKTRIYCWFWWANFHMEKTPIFNPDLKGQYCGSTFEPDRTCYWFVQKDGLFVKDAKVQNATPVKMQSWKV